MRLIPKADWEKAKAQYPSYALGKDEWVAFFETPAGFHAMGQLIRDIYDEVLAEQEREAGHRQMGRRPNRNERPLSEVYEQDFPKPYSMYPFPVAMQKLLDKHPSQRAFCRKVPIHQTTLSLYMSGKRKPDLHMLERIAAAARVKPSFFVEWRAMYVSEMVLNVLLQSPNVGVRAVNTVHFARRQFDAEQQLARQIERTEGVERRVLSGK